MSSIHLLQILFKVHLFCILRKQNNAMKDMKENFIPLCPSQLSSICRQMHANKNIHLKSTIRKTSNKHENGLLPATPTVRISADTRKYIFAFTLDEGNKDITSK